MRLTDLLGPRAIVSPLIATTKKDALLELAQRAAELSVQSARDIFDAVLQRERLGSTGIGDGVAIPHGKLAKLSAIYGLFARSERPLDFDALDGAPGIHAIACDTDGIDGTEDNAGAVAAHRGEREGIQGGPSGNAG